MRRSQVDALIVERLLYEARRPDLISDGRAAVAGTSPTRDELERRLRDLVAGGGDFSPGRASLLGAIDAHDPLIAAVELYEPPMRGGALFVGTGFATSRQLGSALPFDLLMTILVADRQRRMFDLEQVVHLIADNHATTNTFADPREVRRLAAEAEEDIPRVVAALGIEDYNVVLGSEVERSQTYRDLLAKVPRGIGHEYVRREVADIEWARVTQGAVAKLGWTAHRDPAAATRQRSFDERRFDAAHRVAFGHPLSNIYTHPGRNDDPRRPRVAPYVMLSEEVRPTLRPSAEPPINPVSHEMCAHIDRLAAVAELRLGFDDDPERTYGERVQRIRKALFETTAPTRRKTMASAATPPTERRYDLIDELEERGLIADCTDVEALRALLQSDREVRAYVGFDPTAASLHVGSLQPLAVMRIFQRHGYRPILLIGGATGMIGDPSGRSKERNLLPLETLDANRKALREQMARLLPGEGGTAPMFVDNRDWFESMSLIEFLRTVGKHAPVGEMLTRRSVTSRLASSTGLSFTEFAYSLMQAFDFWHLRKHESCAIQFGGTDQWGNILAGVDYMRRVDSLTGHGLVWPLLEKPDGEKFGKTADGNVWLAAEQTSRFRFHQYWMTQDDAIVRDLLLRFTERTPMEIDALMAEHETDPRRRVAQRALAHDVTTWVHGEGAARSAEEAAAVLFSGRAPGSVRPATLDVLEEEIGATYIRRTDAAEVTVDKLACQTGLCTSLSDARREIQAGGLYVDGARLVEAGPLDEEVLSRPYALLRRGKRNYALLRFA